MGAEPGDESTHWAFDGSEAESVAHASPVDGTRTRSLLLALVTLLIVLASPLLAGYAGPEAAVRVHVWRPWRQSLTVRVDTAPAIPASTQDRVRFIVHYDEPPGDSGAHGRQTVWVTAVRSHLLLPWVVAESTTGP